MPTVSIVIRAKNEEQWIKHCLKMVQAQSYKDYEIVLVDNESQDLTVAVAERLGIDKLVTIKDYLPGLAINQGIEVSDGDYLVILSAHCVPRDERWLEALLASCDDPAVAGAYGRQIPVSFSSDNDKRDLLMTFGLDRRVQIKDYFFHNANSFIRRDAWEQYPFDAQTTNIEDRIWAKEVVSAGYHLVYEPEAVVYHHHGIHQDLNVQRASSIVSILEKVDADDLVDLPSTMTPENTHVVAVCPVLGEIKHHNGDDLLRDLIDHLRSSCYVNDIYLLSEKEAVRQVATGAGVGFIERPEELYSPEKTIEDVLSYALGEVEKAGDYPDVVLYSNYLFPNRPEEFFDDLIDEIQVKGLDTVFGGLPDYDNYWMEESSRGYQVIGDGMKPRLTKRPLYRGLYGLGTVMTVSQLRSGSMFGERVGIIPIEDERFAVKFNPYG